MPNVRGDKKAHATPIAWRRVPRVLLAASSLGLLLILGAYVSEAPAQEPYDWWHGTLTREVVTTQEGATFDSRTETTSTIVLTGPVPDENEEHSTGQSAGSVDAVTDYPQAILCGQLLKEEYKGAGPYLNQISDPIDYRIWYGGGAVWHIQAVGGSNLINSLTTTTRVNPPGCNQPPVSQDSTFPIPQPLGDPPGGSSAEWLYLSDEDMTPVPGGETVTTTTINLSRRYDTDCDGTDDLTELEAETPIDAPHECGPRLPLREALCDVGQPASLATGFLGFMYEAGGAAANAFGMGVAGLGLGVTGLACAIGQEPSNPIAHKACIGLSAAAVATGVVTLLPGIGWGVGAISLATGLSSALACHIDPPDLDYTTIATPERLPSPIPPDAPGKRPIVRAVKKVVRNSLTLWSTGEAMIKCINRASGADQAGDAEWEALQRECAAQYANEAADLYAAQRGLRRELVGAMRNADASNPKLPDRLLKDNVTRIERSMTKGLGDATPEEQAFIDEHVGPTVRSMRVPDRLFDAIWGPRIEERPRGRCEVVPPARFGLRRVVSGGNGPPTSVVSHSSCYVPRRRTRAMLALRVMGLPADLAAGQHAAPRGRIKEELASHIAADPGLGAKSTVQVLTETGRGLVVRLVAVKLSSSDTHALEDHLEDRGGPRRVAPSLHRAGRGARARDPRSDRDRRNRRPARC